MFVYVYCLSKRRFLLLFLLLLFCVCRAVGGSVGRTVGDERGTWNLAQEHPRQETNKHIEEYRRQASRQEAIRRTCFLVVIMLEARPLRLEPITIPPVELCYSTFLRTIYT